MKRILLVPVEAAVAAAHLYRELALSALSLLPRRRRTQREELVPVSAS